MSDAAFDIRDTEEVVLFSTMFEPAICSTSRSLVVMVVSVYRPTYVVYAELKVLKHPVNVESAER
jgi:hypothetical protein